MDVREALYTTRAMRRVRPDPIPADVQARILDAAIRAPSGGNAQGWRFLLVDDPAVKAGLGPLYRDSITKLWQTAYASRLALARSAPQDPDSISLLKIQASAQYLADHFEQVPLFLAAFSRREPKASAAHSRRCLAFFTDRRRTRSSACRPTRAGACTASCRSATPPGGGRWHPAGRYTRWRTATRGAPTSASRSASHSGRPTPAEPPGSRVARATDAPDRQQAGAGRRAARGPS
jgi:nitroreductase